MQSHEWHTDAVGEWMRDVPDREYKKIMKLVSLLRDLTIEEPDNHKDARELLRQLDRM